MGFSGNSELLKVDENREFSSRIPGIGIFGILPWEFRVLFSPGTGGNPGIFTPNSWELQGLAADLWNSEGKNSWIWEGRGSRSLGSAWEFGGSDFWWNSEGKSLILGRGGGVPPSSFQAHPGFCGIPSGLERIPGPGRLRDVPRASDLGILGS